MAGLGITSVRDEQDCGYSKTVAPATQRQVESADRNSRCELFLIPLDGDLNAVIAYWRNLWPGQGSAVLTCRGGDAWAAYFRGMSRQTIQQYFFATDTHYLLDRLSSFPHLKQRKLDRGYLARVIDAVKLHLKVASLVETTTAEQTNEEIHCMGNPVGGHKPS